MKVYRIEAFFDTLPFELLLREDDLNRFFSPRIGQSDLAKDVQDTDEYRLVTEILFTLG